MHCNTHYKIKPIINIMNGFEILFYLLIYIKSKIALLNETFLYWKEHTCCICRLTCKNIRCVGVKLNKRLSVFNYKHDMIKEKEEVCIYSLVHLLIG